MNIFRKLNGLFLLLISGAILTMTITACKKTETVNGGGNPPASSKIIDKVNSDPELTQLKAIVEKGQLITKLSENGPFTLLAPVDAFLNDPSIKSAVTTPILQDPDPIVAETYALFHIIEGKYLSKDIPTIVTPGTKGTYQNENIKVFTISTTNNAKDSVFITKIPSGDIYVNGIRVDGNKKDISADNGVIHKLNSDNGFILPSFRNALDEINRQTTSENGLDSLAKAIKRAGVVFPGGVTAFENILKNSIITIIAPTNKAFKDFFANQPTYKKIDDWAPNDLLSLLTDHVILGRKYIPNIAFATSPQGGATGVDNYLGVPIKYNQGANGLYLNATSGAADLVFPNFPLLNGTLHKVGKIMFR